MSYPGGRGKADYLALGDWNVVCFDCGRKFKASMMRRNWQGFYECPDHWTPRQPQDFVRSVPDKQTPPWVQPMPEDVFASGSPTTYLISPCPTLNVPFTFVCPETNVYGAVFFSCIFYIYQYTTGPVAAGTFTADQTYTLILT